MKVAIVGSRDYPDMEMVRYYVASFPPDTVVISGGARGVDHAAETHARERGLDVEVYRADWDTQGKRAGVMRNVDIVNACDRVVAFWDGVSKGTKHTIDTARAQGKHVAIIYPRGVN